MKLINIFDVKDKAILIENEIEWAWNGIFAIQH